MSVVERQCARSPCGWLAHILFASVASDRGFTLSASLQIVHSGCLDVPICFVATQPGLYILLVHNTTWNVTQAMPQHNLQACLSVTAAAARPFEHLHSWGPSHPFSQLSCWVASRAEKEQNADNTFGASGVAISILSVRLSDSLRFCPVGGVFLLASDAKISLSHSILGEEKDNVFSSVYTMSSYRHVVQEMQPDSWHLTCAWQWLHRRKQLESSYSSIEAACQD